jgi:DMSO/TMAO reductase YedYZ molybdopterin-dependent catalytic subunit
VLTIKGIFTYKNVRSIVLRKLGKSTVVPNNLNSDIPPGQSVTQKFPILTYGQTPEVSQDTWAFRAFGSVTEELEIDFKTLLSMTQTQLTRDFHCVTQWSNLDNLWEGVQFREILNLIKFKPEARHVMVHCYGGYSTNLTIDTLTESDVLLAHKHNGEVLTPEHGSPVRLLVPSRYGWKSAKWVSGVEFMCIAQPGFWEKLGYHNNGDPWKEQRYQL